MNRRKALKLMSFSLAAPFAASSLSQLFSPAIAQSKSSSAVFSKTTWADRDVQQYIRNILLVNLANIEIPENNVSIGFPLSDMPRPTDQFGVSLSHIGLVGDSFEDISDNYNPSAFLDLMKEVMRPSDDEMWAAAIAAADALQSNLQALNSPQGIAPALAVAGIGLGVSMVGVAIATASLVVTAIGVGSSLYSSYNDNADDDGDGVRNALDKWPNDASRNVKAELDLDGDGIPDNARFGFLAQDMATAVGIGPNFTQNLNMQVSFTANDSNLIIDCAVSSEGVTTAQRLIVEA